MKYTDTDTDTDTDTFNCSKQLINWYIQSIPLKNDRLDTVLQKLQTAYLYAQKQGYQNVEIHWDWIAKQCCIYGSRLETTNELEQRKLLNPQYQQYLKLKKIYEE